jgi:hypothetical protein
MGVRYNARELQALEHLAEDPEVLDVLQEIGERIAERARDLAPRDSPSHGGAESIRAEIGRDPITGLEVRVSWDRPPFYMGSEHQPARPFLRPAAAPYQT